MKAAGLQRLQKKLEQGKGLTAKEAKELEKLKAEHGLTDTGTVKTITALAKALGVSRKTIYQWKKEPGFPVEPDGMFDPERISQWRSGQGLSSDQAAEGNGNIVSDKVFWDVEFRKFRAKLSEVAYKKEKGELISRSKVEALLIDRAVEFKKALLSMARRLSLRLVYKDSHACQKILEEDSLQILESYSRDNPITGRKSKRKVRSGKKKS